MIYRFTLPSDLPAIKESEMNFISTWVSRTIVNIGYYIEDEMVGLALKDIFSEAQFACIYHHVEDLCRNKKFISSIILSIIND